MKQNHVSVCIFGVNLCRLLAAPLTDALFPVARPAFLLLCVSCVGKRSPTWRVHPARCFVGNGDTAVINIFSLRCSFPWQEKNKTSTIYKNIFTSEFICNYNPIPLPPFFAGLLMPQQHIQF